MQADFCLEMLESAFNKYQTPEIINSDQGSQFTSCDWIKSLADNNIKISMDGRTVVNVLRSFSFGILFDDNLKKSY